MGDCDSQVVPGIGEGSVKKGARLPRRDCPDCDGSGFVPKAPKRGERVTKCHCWRWVSFSRGEVRDGKQAATGEL